VEVISTKSAPGVLRESGAKKTTDLPLLNDPQAQLLCRNDYANAGRRKNDNRNAVTEHSLAERRIEVSETRRITMMNARRRAP
jgi:hypothetical protein